MCYRYSTIKCVCAHVWILWWYKKKMINSGVTATLLVPQNSGETGRQLKNRIAILDKNRTQYKTRPSDGVMAS